MHSHNHRHFLVPRGPSRTFLEPLILYINLHVSVTEQNLNFDSDYIGSRGRFLFTVYRFHRWLTATSVYRNHSQMGMRRNGSSDLIYAAGPMNGATEEGTETSDFAGRRGLGNMVRVE